MRSRRPLPGVPFQRSEHLVAYWDAEGLRLRNYATANDFPLEESAYAVLNACATWTTVSALAKRCPELGLTDIRQAVAMLHREGFLRSKGQPPTPSERAMRKLSAWNPEVGFFHSATRDLMFASLDEARSYRQERSEPWVGSVYAPRGIRRTLPVPHAPSPVSAAFLDRRSWRRFAKKTLSLDHLSTLLWLSGGVQKWATTPAGRFALKTGPSGGALHPIELYVMVRRVEGLAPGFYHYGGDRHRLTRLTRHAKPASVLRYLPQQPWFEPAAAIVFLVAHYERCLWRYKYARAYRAPFIEAGHVAQTFCTIATSLGLAPFVSMALADSNIEHEIGADGITRAVLYATGVGHRPGNVAHANMPEGITTVRVTDNHPRSGRRR